MASLPAPLAQNVFSRLPVDDRARCATVRRSWRAAVLERSLWTRLDMSTTSGVTCTINDAALLAAAARAGGRLEALDLWGRNENDEDESHYSHEALLAVATANSDTLRELRCCADDANLYVSRIAELETLLRAVPLLRVLETSVKLTAADAGRVLRNEPPFEPVRLAKLSVRDMQVNGNNGATALALAAGVLVHAAPLVELELGNPPLYEEEVLDAVVDAVLERRVRCVEFSGEWMGLTPASVPALVRLLGGDALQELRIFCDEDDHVLDNHSAGQLAAALRANTTLTSMTLSSVLCHNAAASVVLLRALTAHPSLRKLDLRWTRFAARPGAWPFRAIAALVAANAPALQELSVRKCGLQDAGLGPLLDALAGNTHLRVLDVSANGMSNTFARHRLLPALRANTSLRRLTAVTDQMDSDELFESDAAPYPDMEWFARRAEEERTGELQADAEALVAARGNGDAS